MADMAVLQGAVSAWLGILVAATVGLLTAMALPRWVIVTTDVTGTQQEADVGLWQICRPSESAYNCTSLSSASTTGPLSELPGNLY